MKKDIEFTKMIERITQMEQYYDIVCDAIYKEDVSLRGNKELQEMIALLEDYVESGLWIADFECDERGELPKELKRGVLSEDGLYNLLCDVERYM